MAKLKRIGKANLQYLIEGRIRLVFWVEHEMNPHQNTGIKFRKQLEKNQLLNAWFCDQLKWTMRDEVSKRQT